jgi:hypothetical protein
MKREFVARREMVRARASLFNSQLFRIQKNSVNNFMMFDKKEYEKLGNRLIRYNGVFTAAFYWSN